MNGALALPRETAAKNRTKTGRVSICVVRHQLDGAKQKKNYFLQQQPQQQWNAIITCKYVERVNERASGVWRSAVYIVYYYSNCNGKIDLRIADNRQPRAGNDDDDGTKAKTATTDETAKQRTVRRGDDAQHRRRFLFTNKKN